jgi:hypothetical protein
MAKKKKSVPSKEAKPKKKLSRIEKYKKVEQDEYNAKLKEEDLNPNHKEDFEKLLGGLIEMNPDDLDLDSGAD